jgi:hypothetical protein
MGNTKSKLSSKKTPILILLPFDEEKSFDEFMDKKEFRKGSRFFIVLKKEFKVKCLFFRSEKDELDVLIFPKLKKSISEWENLWISEFGEIFFDITYFIIIGDIKEIEEKNTERHNEKEIEALIPIQKNGPLNGFDIDFLNRYLNLENYLVNTDVLTNSYQTLRKKQKLGVILTKSCYVEKSTLFCLAYFQKLKKTDRDRFKSSQDMIFKWSLIDLSNTYLDFFKEIFKMNYIKFPIDTKNQRDFSLTYSETWKIKMTEISSSEIQFKLMPYKID